MRRQREPCLAPAGSSEQYRIDDDGQLIRLTAAIDLKQGACRTFWNSEYMANHAMTLDPVSDNRSRTMTRNGQKFSLAIAIFDSGESFCRAIDDLTRLGFTREQMGAAALAAALVPTRPQSHGGSEGDIPERILAEMESIPVKIDGQSVVITRGSFWQRIGCFGRDATDALVTATWMTPQLRTDVVSFIRAGALLLAVSANNFDQQRQSARTLLKYSPHRVQTHEFSA